MTPSRGRRLYNLGLATACGERLPAWIDKVATAHLHAIDCHEMPCLAAVSWVQGDAERFDIGDAVAEHVDLDVGIAAPYGRLVEKRGDESIAALTVVAVFPTDFMGEWPVRIDYRAETLLDTERRLGCTTPGTCKSSAAPAGPHAGHAH